MTPAPRLAGLLLAAGGSRRLGRCKQLIEIDGRPLVRRAAELLLGIEPGETVVVVGAEAAAVTTALAGLELTIVENPDWRAGMGGSIAAGIAALGSDHDGVLILPCDQWRLESADLDRLRVAWLDDPARIVASRWAEAFGPPAIFPARHFPALRALTGDAGARALIRQEVESVRLVPVANAGRDLDTPADLVAISGGSAGS